MKGYIVKNLSLEKEFIVGVYLREERADQVVEILNMNGNASKEECDVIP